jgi:hypothetical protein
MRLNAGNRLKIIALSSLLLAAISCATQKHEADRNSARAHKDAEFTEFFRRSSGWTAGDGAVSVGLSDGRVLWLFGDSHVDDIDAKSGTMPCLFQARNAALLHWNNDLKEVKTLIGKQKGFRSFFKNSEDETARWFWPVCGFQRGEAVYVYLAAMKKTGAGGAWGFAAAEHDYWGKMKFPEMVVTDYVPLPSFNGITFGNGFVQEKDGYTYAFGGKGNGLASDVYVARFKDPEKDWRFWDGKNWAGNVREAVPVTKGASTSIHVCKVRGRYLLTTSEFSVACDQGKEIYISTSRSPVGPFSPRKSVYSIDDFYEGHRPFFYLPSAHPEFINSQGELLITYSINGYNPCVPDCKDGRAIPDHYRPRAIRLPLDALE